MAGHFRELDQAARSKSRPVAWLTSVGPAELCLALGFLVYYPENHGAMLGATRMAADLIPRANAVGYSPDICSYLTSDVGAHLAGLTPLQQAYNIEAPPRPDVLVFNTNQCRDVKDWFRFYSQKWSVPLIGVHTHRSIGPVKKHHLDDIAAQLKGLIPPLEEISGNKFDLDELSRRVGLSGECSRLWRACLETAAQRPAPWTFFDHTIHMGPAVVMRGREMANDYYRLLLQELKQRAEAKTAAVPGERHRLYWEGMPIWGKLRANSELFKSQGAAIVASTYCNSWIFDAFDPKEPFESMARAYTELFIVRDEAYKESYIKDHVHRFKIDGLIFHDAKTCPNNSNNRYGMPERLRTELGIPTLTINGDLNDLRCYSEEQTRTNVEAFVEQLEEKAA
ncbi:MAG: 2-hydroxyacyl-CoA dehydratase [Deltaproteobacteria bacterium]|nr:2-hydroxyacyl-CoA dehydratase [Deltaproteobacteria bacterium]